jgi:hypothetical protein
MMTSNLHGNIVYHAIGPWLLLQTCWYIFHVDFLHIVQEIDLSFTREDAKVLQFLWLCQQLRQAKVVCLIGQ